MRKKSALALLGLTALIVSGCSGTPVADLSTATPAPTPTASETPTPTATPEPTAETQLALEEQVASLFMVGHALDGYNEGTAGDLTGIGGFFVHGRSTNEGSPSGITAVSEFITNFVAADGDPLWVATDQEGGEVQVLSGEGFSEIPSAVEQGSWASADLLSAATQWGAELAQVGVNMNLAPVADIVTSSEEANDNAPIGYLDRQYGYDRATVADKAGAFAEGMRANGILPVFKHFPGLGRVTENTDYAENVVDYVVTPESEDIAVYSDLLAQGPAAVMLSSAYYENIDPDNPAMFSPTIVTDILRGQLGFDGLVMTDDVAAALAVESWSPGERAIRALGAGVDMLLISADQSVYPEMYQAVLAEAQRNPAFAARVLESSNRIADAKTLLTAEN